MTSNNFKKILVPVDGSKCSNKALLRSCELVEVFNSKLILLYVAEKSTPVNLLDRKEYMELIRKFGNKTLERATHVVEKKNISCKTILKEGNVVSEIKKVVKSENCDLIIVGNKGLGAVGRFLLGSVSNKLAQHAPCSVLIVK